MVKATKIDLACGARKKEGFYGIDIAKTDSVDLVHDLTIYPWPIADNSVDEIYSSHYIEHIPHINIKSLVSQASSFDEFKELLQNKRDGFIEFIDELYRILKVGGKAELIAPYYMSVRAFGDPTHVRYIGDLSFPYFNKEWRENNKLEHYNIKSDFDMKFNYHIREDLLLHSEERQKFTFQNYWNNINDIIVELIKR